MTGQPPPSTNDEIVLSEEDFLGVNSLVEQGNTVALERFLTDKKITPKIYYQYFRSHYVYGRCCAVGLAAKCGQLDVMKKMISWGFSVKEKCYHFLDVCPIHLACEAGHVAVVKSLVEKYGVHAENCFNESALCCAASNGKLEVIRYFLENGTDVNSQFGLHRKSLLHSAAEEDQSDVCKYLLSKGADVDICTIHKVTPLSMAAQFGCDVTARVLLDAGADVNFVNLEEMTPFLKAAKDGQLNMMKVLLSHGADPDQCDRFKSSPLYYAVRGNFVDTAHYLIIELNVRLEPEENSVESTFRVALRSLHFDMVDLLLRAGYNPVEEVEEFYEDSDDDDDGIEDKVMNRPKISRPYKTTKYTELNKKLKELIHIIRNPRSLQALSVYTIRRQLGRRLSTNVDRLPVCEPLKKIVMYCDVTV